MKTLFKSLRALPILCLAFALPNFAHAQLTFESVQNHKLKTIKYGREIGLTYNTISKDENCNCCFIVYNGFLRSKDLAGIQLQIKESKRQYVDTDEIAKKQVTTYKWEDSKPTTLPIPGLKAISVNRPVMKTLDVVGALMIGVSLVQGMIINPFWDGQDRKVLDRIAFGTLSTGIVFAALPNRKTYYFEQPAKPNPRIWRLTN